MLHYIDRTIDAVTRGMLLLAGTLLLFLVILLNVEVAMRYLLNSSTLIADEYGGYALVWICLLGFSQALRSGQFLNIDAVVSRLPPLGGRLSLMLGALVGIAAALLLTYTTFKLAHGNFRFGSVSIQPSATPLWIPQVILPIGFGWLCVVYAQQFLHAAWPRAFARDRRS